MPTLEEVIALATAGKRVCPMPQRWNELWEMLPDRKRIGNGWHPSLPLILAAWWETSDTEKRERFITHLRYASEHGVLDQVSSFLSALTFEQWHHEGD